MDAPSISDFTGTITAIATAAKALSEAIGGLRSKVKGNKEVDEIASAALERVLAVQSTALDLQTMAFGLQQELAETKHQLVELQEENSRLRAQIREKDEWAAERKKYRLEAVPSGSAAVVRDETPGIYYCPSCFQASGRAIPLQPVRTTRQTQRFGSHVCPVCSTVLQLGTAR